MTIVTLLVNTLLSLVIFVGVAVAMSSTNKDLKRDSISFLIVIMVIIFLRR